MIYENYKVDVSMLMKIFPKNFILGMNRDILYVCGVGSKYGKVQKDIKRCMYDET